MIGENGPGPDDTSIRKEFSIGQVFLKNAAFDAPSVPRMNYGVESMEWNDVDISIGSSAQRLLEDRYEVILHLGVHAKRDGVTVFRATVEQVGVFRVKGYTDEEARAVLPIRGGELVYPYAREFVLSMLGRSGVQRLQLPPRAFNTPRDGDQQETMTPGA